MPGFDSDTVGNGGTLFATNVDFTGTSFTSGSPQVVSNGQLLIGNAATPRIRVGTITSPSGTISIGYAAPNITLDIAGASQAVEHLTGTTGGQLNPDASHNFNILGGTVAAGTTPVAVAGVASTLTVNLQTAQAIASTNATNIGLAAFNSADFSVDANGFVSVISGGFKWQEVSGAFSSAAENGYFITATASTTLPASPAEGTTIKFSVDSTQLLTITAGGTNVIRLGTTVSAAGGTAVNTQRGDGISLTFKTTNSVWMATDSVGGWNIT